MNTPLSTAQEAAWILEQAVEALERETDIRPDVGPAESQRGDGTRADFSLFIDGEMYIAEVKAWAQHTPLGLLMERVKRHRNGILIADYVNPKMADRLREADVQFMDTAGNAYIKTPTHHVRIKGNRNPVTAAQGTRPRRLRGFTAAGLRVTYQLLCKPDLVGAPYREIAAESGVALGTVGNVIDDLAAAGFLVVRNDERRLVRTQKMLETWVDRYPAALRTKLQLGVFQSQSMDWWRKFPILDFRACWGGEIAAAHYTRYLRPVVATVYVPRQHQAKLISAARLKKAAYQRFEPGTVELLTPFWPLDQASQNPHVHPILAYADLIATGDPRNVEVARKLYEERIAEHLG
jgi:hypothetical protein